MAPTLKANQADFLELKADLETLKTRVLELEKANKQLLSKLNEKNKSNDSSSPSSFTSWTNMIKGKKTPVDKLIVLNAVANEEQSRNSKKKNILISGIPDSKNDSKEDRISDDSTEVAKLLVSLDLGNLKPKFIRRIQSKNPSNKGPSPVLVEFPEEENVITILAASYNKRKDKQMENIFINRDLTEAQRLQEFELRKQKRELNGKLKEDSEFYYGIRRNQLTKITKK